MLTGQAQAQDQVDKLSYSQLAEAGKVAVKNGGTYSTRWGDCSSWLKRVSEELIERVFAPYGNYAIQWAKRIAYRESGYCPGAVNSTSGTTSLAQIHPDYHHWVDYKRMKSDPAYAAQVFVRLSKGGKNTQPWCLCN